MSCPRLDTAAAVAALRSGGVLLMQTDTLPGLHAAMDRPEAVARIVALKGRDPGKPLLLLAAGVEQALAAARDLQPWQEAHCRAVWPGPFTLILPAAEGLPAAATSERRTVAVRVPGLEPLRALLGDLGVPLVSTSANRQGDPPCRTLEEAETAFGGVVDGSWTPAGSGPAGDPAAAVGSALIDLTSHPVRRLRDGPEPYPSGLPGPA